MKRSLGALVVGVVALVATACEPSSPSAGAWRDDAYYAISDVAGDVATAQLTLNKLIEQKVPQNYAQVVLVSAEDEVGKKSDKFGANQPPSGDLGRYHQITSALSDAGDTLSDVRIAVVQHATGRYPRLLHELAQQQASLQKLESAIGGLGGP